MVKRGIGQMITNGMGRISALAIAILTDLASVVHRILSISRLWQRGTTGTHTHMTGSLSAISNEQAKNMSISREESISSAIFQAKNTSYDSIYDVEIKYTIRWPAVAVKKETPNLQLKEGQYDLQ